MFCCVSVCNTWVKWAKETNNKKKKRNGVMVMVVGPAEFYALTEWNSIRNRRARCTHMLSAVEIRPF